MGQALYRTYRSKKLSEVVGQEHITQALSTALKKGLVSHAYLFTGPRGVGKTSIARILAHEINNLPYTDDANHLDIIEIDAASNRRIDEIRDLRDKVHVAPTSAAYKVYIIDEVHMLTREAFNALLKTLEEPPAHVVFILATTEVHKLPETIISRTQRFTFRPGTAKTVTAHLRAIADKEKLKIDDEALALIARHGGGSFRDSIGVLDQMRSLGRAVTKQDVESLLGIAPTELITDVVEATTQHDATKLLATSQQLHDQGAAPAQVAKQLGELLRERFIANDARLSHEQTITLLTKLLEVPVASDPAIYLEIILLDAALAGRPAGQPPHAHPAAPATVTQKTPIPAKPAAAHTVSSPAAITEAVPKKARTAKEASPPSPKSAPTEGEQRALIQKVTGSNPASPATKSSVAGEIGLEPPTERPKPGVTPTDGEALDAAVWPQVLNTIKQSHNTLFSILRTALPSFEAGQVTLEVGFAFHQKRLNESRNKEIIAETIQKVSGQSMHVVCVLGEPLPEGNETPSISGEVAHTVDASSAEVAAITDKPTKTSAKAEGDDPVDYYVAEAEKASARPVDTINNIFGGGELLES